MMSLVIEKMIERRSERLLDILWVDHGAIADRLREIGLAQGTNVTQDALIFIPTGGLQLRDAFIEDRIKTWRDFTLASESPHPYAIAHEKMIERAVQRFEENTAIGVIIGVAHPCSRVK